MEFQVPDFILGQLWLLQPFDEQNSRWKISPFSLALCLSNKIKTSVTMIYTFIYLRWGETEKRDTCYQSPSQMATTDMAGPSSEPDSKQSSQDSK